MKIFLKIIFLLLAILPIWLTIAAIAKDTDAAKLEWKNKLNSQLLKLTGEKQIQVLDLDSNLSEPLSTLSLTDEFEMDLSQIRPTGFSQIELRFKDKEGRLSKLAHFNARLFVREQVPVATRNLTKGSVIQAGDFRLEWRDAATIPTASIRAANPILGRSLKSVVSEGLLFTDAAFENESLISSGDHVKVNVVTKGLVLSTTGIAEESGTKGQMIRILNIESRKEILGVVVDNRLVEVKL